jgi:hypothetical protein
MTINKGFSLTWLGHNSFKLLTRGAKACCSIPGSRAIPPARAS